MNVTVVTPSLSVNCLGRAYLLAKVLARRHQVEVVGPVYPTGVWEPLSRTDFSPIQVPAAFGVKGFAALPNLVSRLRGDVLYASKPLFTYLLCLLAKRKGIPVVVDIDDWEIARIRNVRSKLRYSLRWRQLHDFYPFLWLSFQMIRFANAVTVSSTFLKSKYGGTVVPHGRDTDFLDPARWEKETAKRLTGLPDEQVIMFLGTYRPHKGVEDLLEAARRLYHSKAVVALVGVSSPGKDFLEPVASRLGSQLRIFEMIPFSQVPLFLAAADVVAIPQRSTPFSEAQVPAKVFDAMAMAKPIIATRVSDLPAILDGCGWIVDPESPDQLASALDYVLSHPEEAATCGALARARCIEQYSWEKTGAILEKVLAPYGEEVPG